MEKLLAIAATVLFSVAFVIFAFVSGHDAKLVQELTLAGLACLAGAHV